MRAAASSIASGRPSSRRQISATAAALPSVRAKPGRTARARSTNSATAGEDSSSSSGTVAGSAGSASGGTGYSRSARSPSTVRLVAKITTRGQRASSSPRPGAAWTTCSRLSRISSHAPSPNVSASASTGEPVPRQVGPRHPADGGQDQPGVGDRVQRHEHRARAEAITQPLAHRHRQPGLADPARAGQRHQPHPRTLNQPGHLIDGPLPPQQRRHAHRQRARPTGARRRRRSGRGLAASGGEPLAQQHRQVITHQPAQLSGGPERTVGRRGLVLDAGQQISQPGLAIGRRRLDIQQPRQLTGQLELLLQARDLRAGDELPVPLPVQPDEHIALRQVRPVQLGRRVRPGAELEHHRGQPQRRNGTRNSPPLLSQLTQRGTHEHPQPPVRGPDDHLIPRPLAHRSPLSWPTTQVCNQPPRPARPRQVPIRQPAPAAAGHQALNVGDLRRMYCSDACRRAHPPWLSLPASRWLTATCRGRLLVRNPPGMRVDLPDGHLTQGPAVRAGLGPELPVM